MHQGQERTIVVPGFTIAALEWGPKDGIPVLAIHGWLDNAESFSFLAPLLKSAHIVAVDSPGCGHSSHKSPGSVPSVSDEAFVVMQIAKALGWDKFVLLAHSRGAAVAQFAAAGCPDHIQGLILLDNVGLHPRPALEAWQLAMSAVLRNQPRPATLYKNLDDSVRGRMKAGAISYASAEALTLRGSVAVEGGYNWTFDRRESMFVSAIWVSENQNTEFLGGIKAPTCIILGDNGIWASREQAERQAKFIEKHELHTVPGYHHFHMDDPQPAANIINDFLARLK